MRKNVTFGSIETATSDYDTKDGNLSATYNLIAENASLVPLDAKGKSTDVTIPDNCSLIYIHQVYQSGHSVNRYVIKCVKDGKVSFYHLARGADGKIKVLNQDDISADNTFNLTDPDKVNTISSVGNILCFVGESTTQYALFRDETYIVYKKSDFRFDASLTIEPTHVGEETTVPIYGTTLPLEVIGSKPAWSDGQSSVYNGYYDMYCAIMADSRFPVGDHLDDPKYLVNLTGEQMREVFLTMDAAVVKRIKTNKDAKHILRNIQFGVVAVKMYDGTYYAFSDVFMVAPQVEPFYNLYDMTYIEVDAEEESASFPIDVVDANGELIAESDRPFRAEMCLSPNLKRVYFASQVYKVLLQVSYYNKTDIKDLVQSVDVYLTTPQTLFDYDSGAPYKYHSAASGTDDTSMYYYDFNRLDQAKTAEAIEALGFYKSVSIPSEDLFGDEASKRKVYLEQVTGAGETINLGDLMRKDYGATYSKVYNKRLHLANVTENYELNAPVHASIYSPLVGEQTIRYFSQAAGKTVKDHYTGLSGAYKIYVPQFMGVYLDNTTEILESKIVCTLLDKTQIVDYGTMSYPYMPINMIGLSDVTNVTIYEKYLREGVGEARYRKVSYNTKQSTILGMSYTIEGKGYEGCNSQDILLPLQAWIPSYAYSLDAKEWIKVETDSRVYYGITQDDYDAIRSNTTKSGINVVKVSDTENPLVYPAKNTIDNIGGTIVGMATNTQPISSAQFGDYPLYIFTDEAVWAAKVNTSGTDDGTYMSVAPVSRDSVDLSNSGTSTGSSIVEIGQGVIYPAQRGIMLLSGYKNVCITDMLYGYPFDHTILPHLSDIMTAAGQVVTMTDIDYLTTTEGKREKYKTWYYQSGTSMYYDNVQQRIILSRPDTNWLLAYSIRSGTWGAAKNNVGTSVSCNSSMCMINETIDGTTANTIYEIGNSHDETYKVFACTRPLGLDNKNALKEIETIITRGVFAKGHLKSVVYASRDILNWRLVNTSVDHILRNRVGTPYKYYIVATLGEIAYDESINGLTAEGSERFEKEIH